MKLVTGNSNLKLAKNISDYVGVDLSKCEVKRFADKEIFVEMHENVRGEDVFVIQSTSFPANDNLMELLIIIDTLKRASAKRITAVIPYYGYARQDRKPGPRTPITSKLVANMIDKAGANRVLTMDLHAGQIQGFFDIPTDNLFAAPVLTLNIKDKIKNKIEIKNFIYSIEIFSICFLASSSVAVDSGVNSISCELPDSTSVKRQCIFPDSSYE